MRHDIFGIERFRRQPHVVDGSHPSRENRVALFGILLELCVSAMQRYFYIRVFTQAFDLDIEFIVRRFLAASAGSGCLDGFDELGAENPCVRPDRAT